jgi:hypothetical protein
VLIEELAVGDEPTETVVNEIGVYRRSAIERARETRDRVVRTLGTLLVGISNAASTSTTTHDAENWRFVVSLLILFCNSS